jgi:hypothetical protein
MSGLGKQRVPGRELRDTKRSTSPTTSSLSHALAEECFEAPFLRDPKKRRPCLTHCVFCTRIQHVQPRIPAIGLEIVYQPTDHDDGSRTQPLTAVRLS